MTTLELLLLGGLGALSQEALHLSGLRQSIRTAEARAQFTDPLFWMIGGAIVLMSIAFTYVWFDAVAASPRKLDVFLVGAGAPALLKQGIGAVSAGPGKGQELGTSSGPKLGTRSVLRSYFRLG
jgi:hypothetical protein